MKYEKNNAIKKSILLKKRDMIFDVIKDEKTIIFHPSTTIDLLSQIHQITDLTKRILISDPTFTLTKKSHQSLQNKIDTCSVGREVVFVLSNVLIDEKKHFKYYKFNPYFDAFTRIKNMLFGQNHPDLLPSYNLLKSHNSSAAITSEIQCDKLNNFIAMIKRINRSYSLSKEMNKFQRSAGKNYQSLKLFRVNLLRKKPELYMFEMKLGYRINDAFIETGESYPYLYPQHVQKHLQDYLKLVRKKLRSIKHPGIEYIWKLNHTNQQSWYYNFIIFTTTHNLYNEIKLWFEDTWLDVTAGEGYTDNYTFTNQKEGVNQGLMNLSKGEKGKAGRKELDDLILKISHTDFLFKLDSALSPNLKRTMGRTEL